MATESWYQPFKEFYQHAKALTTAVLGKLGIETSKHSVEHGMMMGVTGATAGTLSSVILYGGFGVVSAVVNQIEYGAARGRVADFYHEELAAKLGKTAAQVRDSDIDLLADGNKKKGIAGNSVIAEEMKHERSIRNVGIGASFLASIAVYTLMHALVPEAGALAAGALAAKVVVGVLAYMAIKSPLVKMGKALMGLNKETTHDLILGIARDRAHGKAITREQVVEVFINANKPLAEYVEAQYGREYDHLSLAEKVRVAADLANLVPADKIAHNINLGTANASELAFTAQGDVSGVLPKVPHDKISDADQPSLIARIGDHCRNFVKAINGKLHPEKAHPIMTLHAINKAQAQHDAQAALPAGDEKQPNFVKELAERRANQVHLTGTPTIQ